MKMESKQLTALQSNNEAACLIDTGNNRSAISILATALKSLQQTLDCVDEDQELSSTMVSLDEYMVHTKNNPVPDYASQEGCLIYNKPIRIPIDVGYSNDAKVRMTTIVVFNLALAHQLSSMEINDTAMKGHLRQAIKLYKLVLNLNSETKANTNLLFTMACFNNLGLAYDHLNDSVSAKQFFQHLLSTLMYMTESGKHNVSHFDIFFRTASRYTFKQKTAAAA